MRQRDVPLEIETSDEVKMPGGETWASREQYLCAKETAAEKARGTIYNVGSVILGW